MRRLGLVCSFIAFCCWPARANTYTAASDSESDVQAKINLASNGDTVQIPCSGTQSVTWTTGLTITTNITLTALGATPNVGPSTFGAGTNCLTILDDDLVYTMFQPTPTYSASNNVLTIQNMNIEPLNGSVAVQSPFIIIGTCTLSGCPDIRLDNILFHNWTNRGLASYLCRLDNVFGVVDHDTVDSSNTGVDGIFNVNNSAYLGGGLFGDNSWAQADSYGTANELYIENNLDNGWEITDCDFADTDADHGGCRYTGRFNQIPTMAGVTFAVHGTETSGRMRGGRLQEVYDNTFACPSGSCTSAVGFRSAVGLIFGNTFTISAGAGINSYASLSAYRTFEAHTPFGSCNGEGAWDTNDGASKSSASAFTSTASTTLTDTSQSWTTNQFAPGSKYYTVFDATKSQMAGIVSNTAHALTIKQPVSWATSDTYYILGTTLYATGTLTSVVQPAPANNYVLTAVDSTQSWTTNQWAVNGDSYSFIDISASQADQVYVGDIGWEVNASTSNSFLMYYYNDDGDNDRPPIAAGDTYIILRASACIDQPARSGGVYISGDSSETTSPTPVGPINETLDPIYEFDDTATGSFGGPAIYTQTMKLLINRDYYQESVNQAAQSNPTIPFNGTSGNGHGTLANMPTTCTTGVGYWATDQGNWSFTSAPQRILGR
jgi:hypothetical protein